MSESTADNAMGPSDVTIGDNEPSMEDILASIRKIIAEDKTAQSTEIPDITDVMGPLELEVESDDTALQTIEEEILPDELVVEQVVVSTTDIEQISDDEANASMLIPEDSTESIESVDDEQDILDLISFVDDNNEGELEVLEEPVKTLDAEATTPVTIGFDEGLDLVMDADASDYATTTLEASGVTVENWKDTKSPAELTDPDMYSIEDRLASAQEQLTEDMSNEEQDIFASVADMEIAIAETADVPSGESEITQDILDVVEDEDEIADTPDSEETLRATPDEDMSLVKSLLADLMDEPEGEFEQNSDEYVGEAVFDSKDSVIETPDTILDNILNASIDDEVQAQLSEDVAEGVEDEAESDLARIARKAFEATDNLETAGLVDDDVVDLGDTDISSKFALVAGAAAAGGAAILASDNDDEAADETQDDDEIQDLDVTDFNVENETELGQDEQALQEHNDTEEDEPMVRIVKTESLVDEDTQKESSSAFASLTSAVNEKTKLEESGPAIGDLVQEALKPMLKEWLDKNLKGIVERAVTKEVKRISSGK